MKNTLLIRIVFCSFALFTSLNLNAGAVDSDNDSTTTNVVSPNSEEENMSTNKSTNLTDKDDVDDENNYSWIGLLGLLGLAGFFKKDRNDINKTLNR